MGFNMAAAKTIAQKEFGWRTINVGCFGWLIHYQWIDHWMDFQLYEIIAKNHDDSVEFQRKGEKGTEFTPDYREAESIDGFIKWDGCCEMGIGTPHFCGRGQVEDFSKVMLAVYDIAAEVLPAWNG